MKHLFEDWATKFGSLALAFLLWFSVINAEKIESSFSVPLTFRGVPENMELVAKSTETITVTVRGHRNAVTSMTSSDIREVVVDATSFQAPGKHEAAIDRNKILVPDGVSIGSVSPAIVTCTLEAISTRKVNVRPLLRGRPLDGFFLKSVRPLIQTVEVEGPESYLADINFVNTEPININGYKNGFLIDVPLKPDRPLVTIKDIQKVLVEINIEEQIAAITLDHVTVHLPVPERMKADPAEISLVLQGPKTVLEGLRGNPAVEAVPVKTFTEAGSFKTEVSIQGLPPKVEVHETNPKEIRVVVAASSPAQPVVEPSPLQTGSKN